MHQFPTRPAALRRCFMPGVVFALFLTTACASTPEPPTFALAAAQTAITSAERDGARQHANAELDEAQQKLAVAKRAVEAQQMLEAEQLAQQATVAAELASARTETAKAEQINAELRRSAAALAEEMQRKGGTR